MGKSLDYPFRYEDGSPASAEGADAVNAGMLNIVKTQQGERINLPRFGVRSAEIAYRNVSTLAQSDIRRQYTLAINRYEPRADVLRVPVKIRDNSGKGFIVEPNIIWRYKGKVYKTRQHISNEELA